MFQWLYKIARRNGDISIIVPTYKNERFIDECIRSIKKSAKKCRKYEILIGIDNCNPTLVHVGKNRLFHDTRTKIYYFSKNVGPYVIRNSLAEKAKYDNILFFDSDDIMMEHMLQTLLVKFEDKDIMKFKFYNFQDGTDHGDPANVSLSSIFSHGAFLIKKEKFMRMNGFYGWKCGADAEFDERYSANEGDIFKLDVPLFYRRYHQNNITRVPETGLESKLRARYGRILDDNRKNKKWKNPEFPALLKCNLIKS